VRGRWVVTATPQVSTQFQARGWLLWLTWVYVALFGIGTVFGIAGLLFGGRVLGLEIRGGDAITVWWLLVQVPYIAFFIGCIGTLLKDRDFAWVAVVSAWAIAVVQCVQAFLQLAHLRLSLPLSAVVFVAYAIGTTKVLRPVPSGARVGRGMM
jgi:hypothetical protein